MKKTVKKTTVSVMTAVLIFLNLFVCLSDVMAGTVYTEGYFYFELEDEAISITGYFGKEDTADIPANIAGYPVSKIASGAFPDGTVKTVNIPDTIMTIEKEAFGPGVTVNYVSDTSKENNPTEDNITNDSSARTESNQSDDNGNYSDYSVSVTDNRTGSSQDIDEAWIEAETDYADDIESAGKNNDDTETSLKNDVNAYLLNTESGTSDTDESAVKSRSTDPAVYVAGILLTVIAGTAAVVIIRKRKV